jgi:hypothetical protein
LNTARATDCVERAKTPITAEVLSQHSCCLPEQWINEEAHRGSEIRMIERIEEIGFELQIELFAEGELAAK